MPLVGDGRGCLRVAVPCGVRSHLLMLSRQGFLPVDGALRLAEPLACTAHAAIFGRRAVILGHGPVILPVSVVFL